MRQEISVTELPNAESVFSAANEAFAAEFGNVTLIKQFIDQVRALPRAQAP